MNYQREIYTKAVLKSAVEHKIISNENKLIMQLLMNNKKMNFKVLKVFVEFIDTYFQFENRISGVKND
jgi:hypothetical protein